MAIDWEKIAGERKQGKSAAELAKRLRVTQTTIYNHTTASGKVRNVVRTRAADRVVNHTASKRPTNGNGNSKHSGMFQDELTSLRQKYAAIGKMIQTMESMGA